MIEYSDEDELSNRIQPHDHVRIVEAVLGGSDMQPQVVSRLEDQWYVQSLIKAAYQLGVEKSSKPNHYAACNSINQPIGGPGCICEVGSKHANVENQKTARLFQFLLDHAVTIKVDTSAEPMNKFGLDIPAKSVMKIEINASDRNAKNTEPTKLAFRRMLQNYMDQVL